MLEPKAEELIKDLINKSNLSYPSDLETAALLAEKAYSVWVLTLPFMSIIKQSIYLFDLNLKAQSIFKNAQI